MKRSILTMVVAVAAFFAVTASASAHVVTVASGGVTCSGITASWTKFPAGPFDMVITMQDTANGKAVTSPYLVEHLTGPSGSQTFAAPALAGVTNRKYLITWTADGGGSASGSVAVKCCKAPPPTTTTTTTPGTTTTTTVPGQTVTVTKTVTTPAVTVTVTTPGPATGPTTTVMVPVPGPTTTVTVPGPVRTRIVRRKSPPKVVTKYRLWPINVICPPGYVGSYAVPIGTKGKPIVARCKRLPRKSVEATGVTG